MWVDRPVRRGGGTIFKTDRDVVTFRGENYVFRSDTSGFRPPVAGQFRITVKAAAHQPRSSITVSLKRQNDQQGESELFAAWDAWLHFGFHPIEIAYAQRVTMAQQATRQLRADVAQTDKSNLHIRSPEVSPNRLTLSGNPSPVKRIQPGRCCGDSISVPAHFNCRARHIRNHADQAARRSFKPVYCPGI